MFIYPNDSSLLEFSCRYCNQVENIQNLKGAMHSFYLCESCGKSYSACTTTTHITCPVDTEHLAANSFLRVEDEQTPAEITLSTKSMQIDINPIFYNNMAVLINQEIAHLRLKENPLYMKYLSSISQKNVSSGFFASIRSMFTFKKQTQKIAASSSIRNEARIFKHDLDFAGVLIGTEVMIQKDPIYPLIRVSTDIHKGRSTNISYTTEFSIEKLSSNIQSLIRRDMSVITPSADLEYSNYYMFNLPSLLGLSNLGFSTRRIDTKETYVLGKTAIVNQTDAEKYDLVYKSFLSIFNKEYPIPLLIFIFCVDDSISYRSTIMLRLLESIVDNNCRIVSYLPATLEKNDYAAVVRAQTVYSQSIISAIFNSLENIEMKMLSIEYWKKHVDSSIRPGYDVLLLYNNINELILSRFTPDVSEYLQRFAQQRLIEFGDTNRLTSLVHMGTNDILLYICHIASRIHNTWYMRRLAFINEKFENDE